MKKYTAITIGPIFKTIQKARSSKAIWSASYLFSYIMEKIYSKVKAELGKEAILLPSYNPEDVQSLKVGVFPDRIMFEGEFKDFDQLKSDIIDDLSDNICKDLKEDKVAIKRFLENYLTINQVQKDFSKEDAVVMELNQLLDTSELNRWANPYANQEFLERFFEITTYNFLTKKTIYNFFIEKVFKGQPVPSLKEIIAGSEKENYIAIVQADGDNFGRFISKLTKKEQIQKVSQCLFTFSTKAAEIVEKNGGVPIYVGGDDLLFFIPVAMQKDNGKQSVLEVLYQLDELFENEVVKPLNAISSDASQLTLSYGVNISYYKFPMDQALSNAGSLLFQKAKGYTDKNTIALRVTKHSGQVFELMIHKNKSQLVAKVKNLLSKSKVENKFISGFMYKLGPLSPIIKAVALSDNIEERFEAFFENYFDEKEHAKSLENGFLRDVRDLMVDIYTEFPKKGNEEEQHQKNLNLIYALLRYDQFINTKTEL